MTVRYFGIRHHGPGCARSLLQALDAFAPELVLVEGPPEGASLLPFVLAPGMEPPVALLSHCPDEPRLAVYHPFASFSPEWQALRWAARQAVPVRFIDLPLVHTLALEKARRDATTPTEAQISATESPALAAENVNISGTSDDTVNTVDLATGQNHDDTTIETVSDPEVSVEDEADGVEDLTTLRSRDPLDRLAHAAGYADGEAWWNHMVEERGDGEDLFAAINEAMTTLRAEWPEPRSDEIEEHREALREAHMRQCVRAAEKEGHARIAVVCGAWHLGGLQGPATVKADTALLKGLPKVKVQSTWVPWTYRHLARTSGYGAGVHSPGWYEHLWRCADQGTPRTIGWLSRVAQLMRARDLDCSSAHLIEAARLADALAAMRDRPAPGLDELHEACRSVLTLGDDAVMRFIHTDLVVGDRLGAVPPDVPTVPLQRDLEQAQKSLRLKPEATQKTLDLDLRNTNDLTRSQLLHRLNLLGVDWGNMSKVGRSSRGTFHELWTLQWQPEFALSLIEASQWGQSVLQAATACVVDRCARVERLDELSALVDKVLLAQLPDATSAAAAALEARAALTGDTHQLLSALTPLANVYRYGNVRQTDATLVSHVLDGLIVRAAISLPLACSALDDDAANDLRHKLLGAHAAVGLRDGEEQTRSWQQALAQVGRGMGAHRLLQGVATRLLLDAGVWRSDEVALAMSLHLSTGAEPGQAAAWLDGFLNRNAVVLLHDATVWQLVDDWLATLSDEHFVRVLPLVRRSFSTFEASERRDLAQRAAQGAQPPQVAATAPGWDEARAELALPLLRQLMGLNS